MVTSGLDKKLKVYDIRFFKPLQSYFLPAGASCLSISQKGLLAAATGDIVQVTYPYTHVHSSCWHVCVCVSVKLTKSIFLCVCSCMQVYRDVWGTPVTKPYMAHRVRGGVTGLSFCPHEDVLGVGHADGFTSMIVPGQHAYTHTHTHTHSLISQTQARHTHMAVLQRFVCLVLRGLYRKYSNRQTLTSSLFLCVM